MNWWLTSLLVVLNMLLVLWWGVIVTVDYANDGHGRMSDLCKFIAVIYASVSISIVGTLTYNAFAGHPTVMLLCRSDTLRIARQQLVERRIRELRQELEGLERELSKTQKEQK